MRVLTLDVGSSSIKATVVARGERHRVAHAHTPLEVDGAKVEVPAAVLLRRVIGVLREAVGANQKIDAIAIDTLSPGVVLWDADGKILAGCVTHQDRRSVAEAEELEQKIGKARHLRLAGNRPIPGGIGSTTLAWFQKHEPGLWKRVAMIGQPSTLIIHALTGRWVIDPSQAAFLGLARQSAPGEWSAELCAALDIDETTLPHLEWADDVAGMLTAGAAKRIGLRAGIPVVGGLVDTGAALLATPMKSGQLLHNCGTTDVLALITRAPKPALDLLTRPIGVRGFGTPWVAVSTIAAAGAALNWLRKLCFPEMADVAWYRHVADCCRAAGQRESTIVFPPLLAGNRTSLVQEKATIAGLSLGTSRDDLLIGAIAGLTAESAQRAARLGQAYRIEKRVITMGGQKDLAAAMHKQWAGGHVFRAVPSEAAVGLGRLAGVALGGRA